MAKDIEGLDEVIKNLNKKFGTPPHVVQDELTKGANKILAEAIQLAPVDTGTLRRSGKVTNQITTMFEVSNEIRFDTNYAVYVHENLEAHHPKGQAKFLESAVNANTKELVKVVATGARSEWKL